MLPEVVTFESSEPKLIHNFVTLKSAFCRYHVSHFRVDLRVEFKGATVIHIFLNELCKISILYL